MQPHGGTVKVWKGLAFVAVAGVAFTVLRGESNAFTAIVIVASCLICAILKIYLDALELRRSKGLVTSHSHKVIVFFLAVFMGSLIIGLSDLTFLVGYHVWLAVSKVLLPVPHTANPPGDMVIGWIVGLVAAMFTVKALEKTVGRWSQRLFERVGVSAALREDSLTDRSIPTNDSPPG